jgi:hypothetical protein
MVGSGGELLAKTYIYTFCTGRKIVLMKLLLFYESPPHRPHPRLDVATEATVFFGRPFLKKDERTLAEPNLIANIFPSA